MRPRRVLPNRTHPTVGDGRVAGPRNRQDRTHGSGSQPVCRRGQRPVVDALCRASRRPGHHQRLRHPTSEVLPHRGARYTRADGIRSWSAPSSFPRDPQTSSPIPRATPTKQTSTPWPQPKSPSDAPPNRLSTALHKTPPAPRWSPSSPEPLTATRLRRRRAVSPQSQPVHSMRAHY